MSKGANLYFARAPCDIFSQFRNVIKILEKIFKKTIDFFLKLWYYIYVKRREEHKGNKKILKKVAKTT